jgi:hypothetical protein
MSHFISRDALRRTALFEGYEIVDTKRGVVDVDVYRFGSAVVSTYWLSDGRQASWPMARIGSAPSTPVRLRGVELRQWFSRTAAAQRTGTGIAGFTVTYKSRKSDTYTSTYRFMVDATRDSDKAWADAYAFMVSINGAGGLAGHPVVVSTNQPTK